MDKLALFGGQKAADRLPTWPIIDQSDIDAVGDVMRSEKLFRGSGSQVDAFEEAYRTYIGTDYALALTNGTAALEIALACAGIGPGDEVIVPGYTFYSSASAISFVGATPVFCDVDLDSYNMTPDSVRSCLTPRTRAIIPVHFAGYPVDMDPIMKIAEEHNLFVLEDCSHAHGTEYKGKKVGSIGHASTWSFQESKNLTSGEGGMVLTNDAKLYDRMYSRHTCGRKIGAAWYEHHTIASNLRMSEMTAALLLNQLKRLETQTTERLANAAILDAAIAEIPELSLAQGAVDYSTRRAYHLYILRYTPGFDGVSRDRFIEALVAEGVSASGGYPLPLQKQPVYRTIVPLDGVPYAEQELPNIELLCRDTIWITQPCLLGDEENGRKIAAAIKKITKQIASLR